MLDRRAFLATSATVGAGLATGPGTGQAAAVPTERAGPVGRATEHGGDAIAALARFMFETPAAAIPAAIVDLTRRQLVDTVAVAIGGRREDGVRELVELYSEIGGAGESVVWGKPLRLPAHDAARITASMAHALEFDDTYGPGYLHPSAITFPAALAVADLVGGISGEDLLTASALAIDVACRLSIAGQPGVDGFATGWHNTTLVGYLSTALLAGRLMGLTERQLVHAAGIAAHQAAGNAQSHIDSTLTKRLGPGFASSAGILAARLAARGVTGPHNVLEGEKGWFAQYHGGIYSRSALVDGLGRTFMAAETSFKPWPSCRGSHTSADAALQLIRAHDIRAEEIVGIVLRNGPAEFPFLSSPIERKRHPESSVEAQFSIPWVVAAAFVDGKVSIAQFTAPALQRADINAMAQRLVAVEDAGLANPQGGPGHAEVEVSLRDGRTLRRRVTAAKGDPAVPMTEQEVDAKFRDCIDYAGLSPEKGAAIRTLATDIGSLADTSQLTHALVAF